MSGQPRTRRLLEARGLGRNATVTQFREGVRNFRRDIEGMTRERAARFRPEVVASYRQRGGYVPKGAGQGSSGPGDLSVEDLIQMYVEDEE